MCRIFVPVDILRPVIQFNVFRTELGCSYTFKGVALTSTQAVPLSPSNHIIIASVSRTEHLRWGKLPNICANTSRRRCVLPRRGRGCILYTVRAERPFFLVFEPLLSSLLLSFVPHLAIPCCTTYTPASTNCHCSCPQPLVMDTQSEEHGHHST